MAREYTVKTSPPKVVSQLDYEADLNEEQFAAATAPPGPSLVIAGAGSGKTRTLTYRVAYLLDNAIQARQILLLTFTNKAAREMLERVEQLVPHETHDLWGGTFHSVGNRILRHHAELLGWGPGYSILDREDQKDLLRKVVDDSPVDTKNQRFPKPDVVGNLFSLAVNTGEGIDDILRARYPYFAHLLGEIEQLHELYEEKKKETNSFDFDDLLCKPLRLLRENPAILEQYQKRFEWVLVDEYQDTNAVQAEFIDLLAAPQDNLMVVGDDAQSIYSWRGADFRNILEFTRHHAGARKYVIETNYRSVPGVLELANASIACNELQFPKNLAPNRERAESPPAFVPLQDTNIQAAFVAQRIEELCDEGMEYGEMAVLYRAHFHSMEIQMELTKRDIPFTITSGLRFFEQAHVKDVAAFMRLVANRKDEVSFRRIARMLPGVGAKTADRLWRSWLSSDLGKEGKTLSFSEDLLGFKVPPKAQSSWEQLAYTLDELVDEDGAPRPPAEMMPSIIEGAYDDYMRAAFPNYDNRVQDLRQLEQFARQFADLDEFLSQLSLLAGQDAADANRDRDKPSADSVTLSTVHQAKGLEWKAVFVVWLAEGRFPSDKVLDNDDEEGTALEEERRLFYVAITRARDELYLTYPVIWPNAYTGEAYQRPSRFLEELPSDLVEEWNTGAGW